MIQFSNMITALPSSLLIEIGIIIILATIVAFVIKLIRQPLIPAYIIAGILIGPVGFGLIQDPTLVKILSELGIAFLLFVVGLEISFKKLKYVGLPATLIGLFEVLIIYLITFFIAINTGFTVFESMIMGLVLAFSSTMVVIKLLSDREQLDTLHGRIILAILLVQDIIVILALSLMGNLDSLSPLTFVVSILRGFVLFIVAYFSSKYLLPGIFRFAAKSKELLFLSAITVLFIFAALSHLLGFSVAIGAFVAGLALASLPYNLDIVGRVTPLKDFFATIFFVSLGMQLVFINFSVFLKPILIFFGIILIIKPFVIFLLSILFGYEGRTSFLAGISLAQISEFSIILVAVPFIFNAIRTEVFSLVIFFAIITMSLASYFIKYDENIYNFLSKFLKIFEKIQTKGKRQKLEYFSRGRGKKREIILVGCHRMGTIFYSTLQKLNKKVLVIDNNPEIIEKLMKQKISCMYGDMRNKEILEKINWNNIKFVISTVPHEEDNIYLTRHVKLENPATQVFVTANHLHQAYRLYNNGADYVILPQILSGEKTSSMLKKVLNDKKAIKRIKEKHLKHLINLDIFKL